MMIRPSGTRTFTSNVICLTSRPRGHRRFKGGTHELTRHRFSHGGLKTRFMRFLRGMGDSGWWLLCGEYVSVTGVYLVWYLWCVVVL